MSARYQHGWLRREGGRWILRRRVDGHEVRLVVGQVSELRTPAAARREADLKLAALNAGPRSTGERITLRRFAPFFLEKICAQKKPQTIATYSSVFEQHLLPNLGSKMLDDITLRDLTSLVATLDAAGKKQSTIKVVFSVLKIATTGARKHGYAANEIDLKPLRLGAKRTIQGTRRCFTREETSRIIGAAAFPWRALYALLAYTGLRCGEALGLPWRSIDFESKQIRLKQGAYMGRLQTTKSAGSAVPLYMAKQLIDVLNAFKVWTLEPLHEPGAAMLREPEPDALLFPSPADLDLPRWSSGVRKSHFAPLLKEIGVAPAGFHAFRHSYATELFRLGKPAPVVQQALRHADIKTTLGYTHVTLQDQRSAADDFAQAIDEAAVVA